MMSNSEIASQLFSGSVSLAGLVLVFLGFIVANYESFDARGKAAVRPTYNKRANVALWGFISALTAAILELAAMWQVGPAFLYVGLAALAAAILLVVILAVITVGSID